jgi:putative transposase
VIELRQHFPLKDLLAMAGLARSTFYYQQSTLTAVDKYAEARSAIQTIFHEHKGRYGYRRVTAALTRLGKPLGHNVVQRLMGQLGLKSLVRPKKYRSYKGEMGIAAPNILQRNFEASDVNQKWATDVTEFNVAGEKVYLSPVMDLCNGQIIAFETDRRPAFSMVTKMLETALATLRGNARPILHSDQGWQYRMPLYQEMLRNERVVQSMSRKGNCHDNAAMESFFAVLKSEYFYLDKFTSVAQFLSGLKEYIHYYNNDRIKTKLDGLSPVQYRTQLSMT